MPTNNEKKGDELPNKVIKDEKQNDALDEWNDRLDENLETDKDNDTEADKKAREFFDENEELNED